MEQQKSWDRTRKLRTEYMDDSDWRQKDNANTGKSVSGMKDRISGQIIAEENIQRIPHGDLHDLGLLYMHDIQYPVETPYCAGHDLYELAIKGIKTASGVNSRPAKHLDTMVDHIVNFLCMAQNECAGAQSFSNVSAILAAFVRADRLGFDSVKQSIQRMVFSLNFENRVAFQQPFTNFTLDWSPPEVFKDMAAIVGGEAQDFAYDDLHREIDLINMAFLEVFMEGDGNGRLFSFPIPTVQITNYDIFESNEVNDKFWELVAKWGTPYFANFIGTGLDASATRSMCCRLNLSAEEAEMPHGLWAIGSKTGSLAVSTVNLAMLGKMAKDEEDFEEKLFELMEKAREQLKYRRNRIEEGRKFGLLPIFSEYVGTPRSFFLTIGICGMHECCMNLFDKSISECEDFVVGTLKKMKTKIREWKTEDGFLYNFEQTPAESASYVMAKKTLKHFPDAFVSRGSDGTPFLTNSTHEPMYNRRTLPERLEWTSKTDHFYTGGTILHIWLNERPNLASVKSLVRKVLDYNIPYFTITPTVTHCEDCGRISYGIRK